MSSSAYTLPDPGSIRDRISKLGNGLHRQHAGDPRLVVIAQHVDILHALIGAVVSNVATRPVRYGPDRSIDEWTKQEIVDFAHERMRFPLDKSQNRAKLIELCREYAAEHDIQIPKRSGLPIQPGHQVMDVAAAPAERVGDYVEDEDGDGSEGASGSKAEAAANDGDAAGSSEEPRVPSSASAGTSDERDPGSGSDGSDEDGGSVDGNGQSPQK